MGIRHCLPTLLCTLRPRPNTFIEIYLGFIEGIFRSLTTALL